MLKISCGSWSFAVLGLAALVSGGANVLASPIQATIGYETTGTVETKGMSGTPVVSFAGVDGGTVTTNGNNLFDLGHFVIGTPTPGTTTTYTNTPFTIKFLEQTVNGALPSPNNTPVEIDGIINGTIAAGATPHFQWGFDRAISTPAMPPLFVTVTTIDPFRVGNLANDFSAWNSTTDGLAIQGMLNTAQAVPEPSALALYCCILSLAVRGLYRGARSRS